MMHMDMSMSPWMWWAMWVPAIIALGALIALGVWAARRFGSPAYRYDARRILEERFARGEIDAEELRSRLDVLETNRRG